MWFPPHCFWHYCIRFYAWTLRTRNPKSEEQRRGLFVILEHRTGDGKFPHTCSRNINFLSTGHAPVFHRSYPHSPQVSPQDKLWKSLFWWGYYPGYWYPGYWGGNWGGGWYYPYPITYSYSTGSLLADMINLKNAPEGQKEKLTVVWNAYISGLLGGSGSLNVNRTTTAINQAFTQSPYLKK